MKEFYVYIDENLPPQIARALQLLQQPMNGKENVTISIYSIKDVFGQGITDEEWIPRIGEMKGVVLTQDLRILSIRHQRELFKEHGVGIFFFSPPSKSGFGYWELVKQIIERWEKIKSIIRKERTPFAYRCSSRTDFQKIDD